MPKPPPPPDPDRAFAKPPTASLPGWLHLSDIQGLAQLATRGTLGVAALAEKVQGNVYKAVAAPFGEAGRRFVDREAGSSGVRKIGITGLVYAGVRGVTRLAGGAVDAVLSRAAPRVATQGSSPRRETMLSVLNGVLGDQLLETANPLTITMSLREGGVSLPMNKAALAQRLPQATGKILLLAHGLCMNDLQWRAQGDASPPDFGRQLAELGYTPVYLHYNTGLHTSVNGGQLATLLEQLRHAWPQEVTEISVLAHSMGGLVARAACHSASSTGLGWPAKLKKIVFLGTPHHGAPLEQLGSWVDTALGSNVVTRPFAAVGQVRSAGITDLRYGHVLPADWQDADRFAAGPDLRQPLPLPAGVSCFAVAATLGAVPAESRGAKPVGAVLDTLRGDGLVPVASALGQHADPALSLAFPTARQWIAVDTGHIALMHSPAVLAQLKAWLA
ncbi:MAG: alpha/beta hydrolase [Polaromonas sp.]|nr:alpha/beta hydrolase [Polaromonas sp.]